jgi:hypothetical protein
MDEEVFSKHVRSRLDGSFDDDPAILTHIKRELKRQLRKMGQWSLSPSYLAFDGESWEYSDALDELANEVYIHCIEKRLQRLGEHLAASGTCDGSVRRKISWFLQDRHEKGNPISRRVYRNVRSASESLVENEKAMAVPEGTVRAQTVILAVGQLAPNTAEELGICFSGCLGDRDFVKVVSRNCPASWRVVEKAIELRIDSGLKGYRIGELTKVFAEICKRPDQFTDSNDFTNDGIGGIWDTITENRTEVSSNRYSTKSEIDEMDQFEAVVQELTGRAYQNIANQRIRERVLKMITKIAELVRQGEDIRELSCRKLATTLDVSKSTIAEDMARLQQPRRDRNSDKSGLES